MTWALAVVGAVVAGAAAVVLLVLPGGEGGRPVSLPADPMPGRLLVGFQDDTSLRWAPDRALVLDRAREANASVVRTIVVWGTTAPRRPANPRDPFDPAYHLDDVDDLARSSQQRGIELLVTIWGTPGWANGGRSPNHPPDDPQDLEDFAEALAGRYSGTHPGYPAVRLFSAWNEPNLEQFLAPQFDEAGRSVSALLYAPLARAVYDGVRSANPDALVAIGETSPRGHDLPSRGRVQDSHSPARFARLLSEVRPRVPFDAWAQHPYPLQPQLAPAALVRWPRVGLGNLERFGESLDAWFVREGVPLWVTEYGHETRPADSLGVDVALQARYVEEALGLVARNPRIRLFTWFVLRDTAGHPWQSGVVAEDGSPKPAFAVFRASARRLDGRNPTLPLAAEVARVSALELAYDTPAGEPVDVSVGETGGVSVPLRPDGWLDVPLVDGTTSPGTRPQTLVLEATDPHGHVVRRVIRLGPTQVDLG